MVTGSRGVLWSPKKAAQCKTQERLFRCQLKTTYPPKPWYFSVATCNRLLQAFNEVVGDVRDRVFGECLLNDRDFLIATAGRIVGQKTLNTRGDVGLHLLLPLIEYIACGIVWI